MYLSLGGARGKLGPDQAASLLHTHPVRLIAALIKTVLLCLFGFGLVGNISFLDAHVASQLPALVTD